MQSKVGVNLGWAIHLPYSEMAHRKEEVMNFLGLNSWEWAALISCTGLAYYMVRQIRKWDGKVRSQ